MGLIVCLDHFDAPQRAGQLAALVQGAGYLIAGVSPWIAGLLRDSLGSFTGAWLGLTAAARCWDWACASTRGAMRHCSPSGRREASAPKACAEEGDGF